MSSCYQVEIMFFLVKPIKNVKSKGKCTETLTEDLCCSNLHTLMNTLWCGRSGLMSHFKVVMKKPNSSVWLKYVYINFSYFEAEKLQSPFSFFTYKENTGHCNKRRKGKTTSLVPLPCIYSLLMQSFSPFTI